MTSEEQRQHPSGKEHMAAVNANAFQLLKQWKAAGKLEPDAGRLTRSQVPAGAQYDAVDDPRETARSKYGLPLRGELGSN